MPADRPSRAPAWLVLADGTIFEGASVGADGEAVGEVVFFTGLTGYQEVITDPSYCGQIVTFTYPHIGNVGVNPVDIESHALNVQGLVMCDYCPQPSNWRSTQPLHHALRQQGVVAIEGVDTRALTRRLRDHGAMPGLISTCATDPRTLVERARDLPGMAGQELVSRVTCQAPYAWDARRWQVAGDAAPAASGLPAMKIVVYDFGVKQNILRCLCDEGAAVEVVPAATPAADVLARKPDGVLLSNGPGDPAAVGYAVDALHALIGRVPLFGICLGHQLLARALGGDTFKLPFGHHGANQPVKDLRTGRVEITSQNHGFAVRAESLPSAAQVTHINLNDQTVEGFCLPDRQLFAVQYHPEASPGPHDSWGLFGEFLQWCRDGKA